MKELATRKYLDIHDKDTRMPKDVMQFFFDYYDGGNPISNGAWVTYKIGESTRREVKDLWRDDEEDDSDTILDAWLKANFKLKEDEVIFIHHWW